MKPMIAMKPAYSITLSGSHASVTAPPRENLSYADELRALGQALENQGLVNFELHAKDADYLVRGWAHSPQETRSYHLLGCMEEVVPPALWGKSDPATQVSEVAYQFPPERIRQLHRDGRKKRVDGAQTPDPCRLSQLLRSTGCYLDRQLGNSLLAIIVKDRWVTLSYVTAAGRIERTKAALDFFYDYWIKMYLRRRDLTDSALRDGHSPMIGRN